MKRSFRPSVVIAGGGVAGLETLLALRAVAGDRVAITLVAPGARFANRSMAVDQPSSARSPRSLKLRDIAHELDARWHRGTVARVEAGAQVVVTEKGEELAYDQLVLALGARPRRAWHSDGVLTFHDADDAHEYRRLLRQLIGGRVARVAFVRPLGASWQLPLYELALATAAHCEACALTVELSLVTPEPQPLDVFGAAVSAEIGVALEGLGVRLFTSTVGVPSRPGRLHLRPGDRRLPFDRIVTVPRLMGPALRGLASTTDGFIRTDAYGRVLGLENVFAAGDATAFPIKQGGLAAQQADAVAASIAAHAGADVTARPFRPVLRGLLTGDGTARYMRADIAGGGGNDCTLSERPLWWPPNRLCGRYLAPYLSARVGGGAVMFQNRSADHGACRSHSADSEGSLAFAELADLTAG